MTFRAALPAPILVVGSGAVIRAVQIVVANVGSAAGKSSSRRLAQIVVRIVLKYIVAPVVMDVFHKVEVSPGQALVGPVLVLVSVCRGLGVVNNRRPCNRILPGSAIRCRVASYATRDSQLRIWPVAAPFGIYGAVLAVMHDMAVGTWPGDLSKGREGYGKYQEKE